MTTPSQAAGRRSWSGRLRALFTSGRWIPVAIVIVLVAFSVLVFYPFLWLIFSSFKEGVEFTYVPPRLLPQHWTLSGYQTAFDPRRANLAQGYFNSLTVTAANVATLLFTSSLCGFAFARLDFPGKTALFYAVLATTMVPFLTLLIPLYILMRDLHLIDTLWSLWVPSTFSPFGIFLCRQFIYGLPLELYDAAKVDGAGDFGIYRRIVLPMSRPVLSVLGIGIFLGSFGSYLWPLIMLHTESRFTLPILLSRVNNRVTEAAARDYQTLMATSILVAVPSLLVFILLQRDLVKGIALTSFRA